MGLLFHEDALSGVSPQDTKRVIEKAEWLWANRQSVSHHPLAANLSGFYKRRLGKYRIIYTYDDSSDPEELVVYLVGTRDEIYRSASKRFQAE
jgi:mRNA interferase RelE/StbE